MKKSVIWAAAGLVGLSAAGAGAMLLRPRPAAPAPQAQARTNPEALGDKLAQRSQGDPDAPITVYEFSDFQCPYCRMFWEKTWPALERDYIATGKMRLVFINYPIPQIHPNAPAAHNFAMCAARQDRFWPAHDLLFRHQRDWEKLIDPTAFFRRLGASIPLDSAGLESCLTQRAEDWLVESDSREAAQVGISGTPAFIVNGGLLPGAQPIEVWRPILDSMYRAAAAAR